MTQSKLLFTSILSMVITTTLLFTILSFRPAPKHESLKNKQDIAKDLPQEPIPAEINLPDQEYFMTEKGEDLIQNELITPLQNKLKIKHNAQMFSRCPSGLAYAILQNPDNPKGYYEGVVENYTGCTGERVCSFRLNATENELQVFHDEKNKFMSTKKWLKNPSGASTSFLGLK